MCGFFPTSLMASVKCKATTKAERMSDIEMVQFGVGTAYNGDRGLQRRGAQRDCARLCGVQGLKCGVLGSAGATRLG